MIPNLLYEIVLSESFKLVNISDLIKSTQKRIRNELEENGLSRIYLKDILKRINKKDLRSVNTWCKKNKVEIFQDHSGRFVIEAEFKQAYNRPIIARYKQKYGENWVQVYELAKENKLYLADENNERISTSRRYTPKSKASSNFLKKFK